MTSGGHAVRHVLRALAEARDGPLYSLYVHLTHCAARPPSIGFRIYQVAESEDVRVVAGVEYERPDGVGMCWSVAVQTVDNEVVVEGSVEVERATGHEDVVELSERTADPARAAALVRQFAAEVSAHRKGIEADGA